MLIKQNALAPMNPVPGRANAAIVSHIIWSVTSFPPAYFPRMWRRPMTALLPSLLRYSKQGVAEKANLGYSYITKHE